MDPRIHSVVLDNGLRVVVVPLDHLHTATVQLHVKVGSRFETPDDSGLSHFVEHMLFRGTEAYPSSYELNFAVERLGATLDAETGRDLSMYPLTVPPGLCGDAVLLLGELVSRPRFDDIELERQILIEELNEDFDERGVEVCADEIARRLLFGDHPLGRRITGPRDNVERFTVDDVRRHHARFYVARNMVLVAAGPVDAGAVVRAARSAFGGLAAGEPATFVPAPEPPGAPQFAYVDQPGSQSDVHLALVGLPEADADYAASVALLRVLDDGMSARLHYRLCDQRGLAYSIAAGIEPLHDCAVFEIEGATAHAKVPDLLAGALELLLELRAEPVSARELDKAKVRYECDAQAALDDAAAIASWYGTLALYGQRPLPSLQSRVDQMRAVTAADVQRAAARIVRPERSAVVIVGTLSRARVAVAREIATAWT